MVKILWFGFAYASCVLPLRAKLTSWHTIAVSTPSSFQDLLIFQEMTTSWTIKGRKNYRYQATVKNNSPKTLQSLRLTVMNVRGPLWGLSRTGPMTYTFPTWMKSLPSERTLVFIYIQPLPLNATISIASAVFSWMIDQYNKTCWMPYQADYTMKREGREEKIYCRIST